LYIHSGNKLLKKIHILFGKIFFKKIIITFHGFDRKKGKISKVTDHFVYSLVDKIIVVNKEISKDLKLPVNKCVIKPAFLPPLMEKETSIPDYLYEIILKAKSDFKTIISSNASRLNTFNNQDLYGLDMCIDLSVKLKNASFPFLFIFNVSSLDEGIELYQNAQESIKINQLEHCFLLLNEEISFVKLIEQSNVILRTTNTDGDALSIREALYLNKPVIASDIVLRPFGTILFKTRNSDDLFSKFTSVVKSINNTPYNYSPNIYFKNQYKRFYKKLIEKQLCT